MNNEFISIFKKFQEECDKIDKCEDCPIYNVCLENHELSVQEKFDNYCTEMNCLDEVVLMFIKAGIEKITEGTIAPEYIKCAVDKLNQSLKSIDYEVKVKEQSRGKLKFEILFFENVVFTC